LDPLQKSELCAHVFVVVFLMNSGGSAEDEIFDTSVGKLEDIMMGMFFLTTIRSCSKKV
jgi:hypothetical protein